MMSVSFSRPSLTCILHWCRWNSGNSFFYKTNQNLVSIFRVFRFRLFSLIFRLRDETRTSYLLQGVESAWESVGKKRSFPSAFSAANHSTEARSKSGRDASGSMEEGSETAEVREEMRGAEAMIETHHKGDSVSCWEYISINMYFPHLTSCCFIVSLVP